MSPRKLLATDWRLQYVVCEHVAALPTNGDPAGPPSDGLQHRRFDVCCKSCADAGFLGADLDITTEPSGIAVGRLPKPTGTNLTGGDR